MRRTGDPVRRVISVAHRKSPVCHVDPQPEVLEDAKIGIEYQEIENLLNEISLWHVA